MYVLLSWLWANKIIMMIMMIMVIIIIIDGSTAGGLQTQLLPVSGQHPMYSRLLFLWRLQSLSWR